jgi:nucleotide-binding universal stress UspA family protein
MTEEIMLAIDGSERGFEVVSIVGNLIKKHPGLHLSLFHCVLEVAALLPGELYAGLKAPQMLTPVDQEQLGKAIFAEALRRLQPTGLPESRITFKLKGFSADPAQDILAEAENGKIRTIAVGRRGLNRLQSILLGSVSSRVAQYARHHTVWIVDTPVHESQEVLVAMEGMPDARAIMTYLAEFIVPIPRLKYTLIHLAPPVPPILWDDGHILSPAEKSKRQRDLDRWWSDYRQKVECFLTEGRDLLIQKGVPEQDVTVVVQPTREGIARDLLNEVAARKCHLVVMGKRSFQEKKPFLLGSHANKILQNLKDSILCLVDS